MTDPANAPANQPATPAVTLTRAKYERLRAMGYAGRVSSMAPGYTADWFHAQHATHWILINDERGATVLAPAAIWGEMSRAEQGAAAAAIADALPAPTAAVLCLAAPGDRLVLDPRWEWAEHRAELVRVDAVVADHGEHYVTDLGAAVREVLVARRTGQ